MSDRLLVVGARPASLGDAVVRAWPEPDEVVTAGIPDDTYEPDYRINVWMESLAKLRHMVRHSGAKHVVCTVGINHPATREGEMQYAELEDHLRVNVIGVVRLLTAWLTEVETNDVHLPHFAVVSSNSAHVARRNSLPYCTSKAALSMAIRCAAREHGGRDNGRAIYCYEPGLLATGQTLEVRDAMTATNALHRIPNFSSRNGFNPHVLADIIVRNILQGGAGDMLNGTCIRLDGGEQ